MPSPTPPKPAKRAPTPRLLDTLGAELKKLVQKGKERGYVTYDELNAALPPDEVSSEQIEDTMAMLSEAGVNVVEAEEQEEAPAANPAEPAKTAVVAAEATGEDEELGRTDDPVRMYLREMGSVELLSPRGRDRDRQAHRGRPGQDDRRHLREPADHHARCWRGATRSTKAACCCATSSTSRRPRAARPARARRADGADGAPCRPPMPRPAMPKLPVVRADAAGQRRRGRASKARPRAARTTTRTRCRCRRSRRS